MHATLIPGRAAAMLFWPHYTSIFFLSPPPIHSYPFPLEYRGQAITHAPKSSHIPINVHLGRPCVGRTVISSTGTAGTSRSRPPADARLVIGTGALRLGSQVRGQQVTQMRAGGGGDSPASACSFVLALYVSILTHTKTIGPGSAEPAPGSGQVSGDPRAFGDSVHALCVGIVAARSCSPRRRRPLVHGDASGAEGLLLLDLLARGLDVRQGASESRAVGSFQQLVARHHGRRLASQCGQRHGL